MARHSVLGACLGGDDLVLESAQTALHSGDALLVDTLLGLAPCDGVGEAVSECGIRRELRAHLLGKLLKTLKTQSKNTSGIAYGGGCVWMAANSSAAPGIHQLDLDGRELSNRQIPLGPPDNGGGCHGIEYLDGKIFIADRYGRPVSLADMRWPPDLYVHPVTGVLCRNDWRRARRA